MKELKQFSNEELIRGLLDEKQEIFHYLYTYVYQSVQWMILSNNGTEEDAKDIFQDAIILMYQKLKKGHFVLNCAFTTYLYSVCKLMWLKNLARKKKNPSIGKDEAEYILLDECPDSEYELELLELYYKEFEQLSRECKKILHLHLRNVPIKEITKALGYKDDRRTSDRKYQCKRYLRNRILTHPLYKKLNEGR